MVTVPALLVAMSRQIANGVITNPSGVVWANHTIRIWWNATS